MKRIAELAATLGTAAAATLCALLLALLEADGPLAPVPPLHAAPLPSANLDPNPFRGA